MPVAEVFKLAVSSLKVNDWNLFGSVAWDEFDSYEERHIVS